ncbi:MAG TPA: excinuclease ABC subunit UvrC [Candidatus Eisenbacteria bacterium]|jgi:excinuclease ABC subunit C|nr:excinuclease ABC subunit UvrC [Candidatus Eisenbacteria bacterium]
MAIPDGIHVKNGPLPPSPGVYLMKGEGGKLLYIGKATSLRTRVGSYFVRPADARIAKMVTEIRAIEYLGTPTAVEALMLEAKLIKKHQPPYNVMEKDDKSFVHLAFTREPFPQPVLIRGYELARTPKRRFMKVYGPFGSAASVRAALDTLRRSFPWTTCKPGRPRPCFYRHLRLCPGVCTGDITSKDYKKIIRSLFRFFEGGRATVAREMRDDMKRAAKAERFEEAAALRNRLYALDHVRDIAVIKRDDAGLEEFIDIFGRIEGYDISNISGQNAVGSMVVFEDGEPRKSEYRIFGIKDVEGPNDVAMMTEVLRRRFARSQGTPEHQWKMPDLVLVDGGVGQLNAAKKVFAEFGLQIPLIGIAKGFDRKQDELVYDKGDYELSRLVQAFKPLLQRLRDEAHRFAISWHRRKRAKDFLA